MTIAFEDTEIDTWFERDRAMVHLRHKDGGKTIAEWWDGAVAEAVTDGFLNPKDYHRSAYDTALGMGALEPGAQPVKISERPMGWVAASSEKGVYCGWERGGIAIWSSTLTDPAAVAKGAWTFDCREDAEETLKEECIEDGEAFNVELDVTEPNRRDPHRASFESCTIAGADALLPQPEPFGTLTPG